VEGREGNLLHGLRGIDFLLVGLSVSFSDVSAISYNFAVMIFFLLKLCAWMVFKFSKTDFTFVYSIAEVGEYKTFSPIGISLVS